MTDDLLGKLLYSPMPVMVGKIRSWLVAHGAADSRKFELISYLLTAEVYVGCAFAHWTAQ